MVIRRIFAALLVFLFVAVSTAAFLVFAVSNTFLRPSFYEKELKDAGYAFLVDATVESIEKADGPIAEYFIREELQAQVEEVFPEALFERTMQELIQEVQTLREDPERPLTFQLSMYRESLLTLAHNLSFKIFQQLPACPPEELPDTRSGIPSCVPADADYSAVSGPLTRQFEKDIYAAIPEQGEFNLKSLFGESAVGIVQFFAGLDTIKMVFYLILLGLLALMALLIYRPFTAILMGEGVAFLMSGVVGLIVGYALMLMPQMSLIEMRGHALYDSILSLINIMVGFFTSEIQKGALVFLATGIILLTVRYFIKRR